MLSLINLEPLIKRNGFDRFGTAPLKEPKSIDAYKTWLDLGFHAGMNYLREQLPLKENPQELLPKARSAIVIAESYAPHPKAENSRLRTALYAQGEDYHHWLQKKLALLRDDLAAAYPSEQFLCFTDSAPVLERDLAYLAGLGWVGKNTCVIHPKFGSLFFIGEIYTTLDLENTAEPLVDMCGTCSRCITACPTGALEPKRLDASKCISYWNIEAKEAAPEELRAKMGDWFFGCDICQTVCPWNEKVFGKDTMRALSAPILTLNQTEREDLVRELNEILNSSNRQLTRKYAHSPLSRPRGNGLKRNALVVIANLKLSEMKPIVERLNKSEFGDLGKLAHWTLSQLQD